MCLNSGETIADFVVHLAMNIHKKRTTKKAAHSKIATVGGIDSIITG